MTAFLCSFASTPVVRSGAVRLGFVDRPNSRSSHERVTPRAGGLAVLAGVGLALALAPYSWWREPAPLAAFAVGAIALAGVGLVDDRWGVPPLVRLAVHVAAAVLVVTSAGGLERVPLPPPLDLPLRSVGVVVGVIWIVAVVNFYNFMDGIDGLAGLQGLVTGVGVALAVSDPLTSFLGAALAGAAAGFLLHNWPPATIFLGDTGSALLGYAFAALPFLTGGGARARVITFVALSLWFFLADASWTLLWRLLRGRRLHEAHRDHLYQRLVISGWSHRRTTLSLGAAALGVTAAGTAAMRSSRAGAWWAAFLMAAALFALEIRLVRSRPRSVEDAGGR
jgi:Fuc2NAc and GlcNAc transferase